MGQGWIADMVAPFLSVDTKSGQIEVVKREALLALEATAKRAPDGSYGRVNQYIGKVDYDCEDIGKEHVVKDGDGTTISYNKELGAVMLLNNIVNTFKEHLFVNTLFTNWSGSSGNVTTSWATLASATPIADLNTAILATTVASGVKPNAIVLNSTTLSYLLNAASTKALFPGAQVVGLDLLNAQLPALLGIKYVFEGSAVYNAAVEGLPFSGAFIVPANKVMICNVPVGVNPADPLAPATMRTPVWAEDAGGGDLVVENYRDEARRGEVYRVRTNIDHVIMDKATGYLLTTTPAET
jgi:hypothetical protein